MADRLFRIQHSPFRVSSWLMLAPFLGLAGIFFARPLVRSFWLSLHRGGEAGGANYLFAVTDPLLWLATANTLGFTLLFLLGQVPMSLGLALLLNDRRLLGGAAGRSVFRLVFFSTHLVGVVFASVLFAGLFGGRRGLVNASLLQLGLIETPVPFLQSPEWVLPIMLATGWFLSVGFGMVYLLAALQQVDSNLYDAARVDGAGAFLRLRHVTLPAIRPTLGFLIVAGGVWGLQTFELPYMLFDGPGPGYRGLTAVMYLFAVGFEQGDLAYASAIGWVWAIVVGVLAVLGSLVGMRDE